MRRLHAEFLGLYILAPVAMAVVLPVGWLFPALFGVTLLGLVLLHLTDGFAWSDLAGDLRVSPVWLLAITLATGGASLLALTVLFPEARFFLLRQNPALMAMIALLYPLLSALPQELVYRVLFFRRYGPVLPAGQGAAIALNAALFSLAHLVYWNAIVAAMTFAGGLVFAASWRARGRFAEAVVLHSVAGIVLFACGMGVWFYSGNVERPF